MLCDEKHVSVFLCSYWVLSKFQAGYWCYIKVHTVENAHL